MAPFSIISGRGTLNRTGRSASNTAVTTLTAGELKAKLGVFRSSNDILFISPDVKGADGRAVAADGRAPFPGQVFFNPEPGRVGGLERRMFNGPHFFNWDFALAKETRLRENLALMLRLEAFNLPNNVVFLVDDFAGNINSPGFGRISRTANQARSLQATLRLTF